MKKILIILAGLLVTVIIVAIYMLPDTVSKKDAQGYAQNLLKTPVTIGQFRNSLFDKNLEIGFAEVQNLPNFKNKNALSLDNFSVKVSEFDDDLIVVDMLVFEGLNFVLENNNAEINLTKLFDNLGQKSENSSSLNKNGSKNESNQRVKIKQFKVNNINLKIDTDWLKTTLSVPNISVNSFGGESGVKLDDVGEQIIKKIYQALKTTLEKEGIENGRKKIKQSLRRKIERELGIENGIDVKKLKVKAKEMFKSL